MTFRDFVEQALSDFETQLRGEELEPAAIAARLRGAQQFVLLLLGEAPRKGPTPTRRVQDTGKDTRHRFGGPR
jgi:hypothetical protein